MYIKARKIFDIQYLSPTGLDCFVRCPAKYYFEKLERLVQGDAYVLPLSFGKCIHASLCYAYTDPAKACSVFDSYWAEESVVEDSKRCRTRAHEMLTHFCLFHTQAKLYKPLDPPAGICETSEKYSDYEAPFLIDVGGPMPFYGKIDRFVEWEGEIWPLDYKTASQVTARVVDNLEICSQSLGYTLAGSQLQGRLLKGMFVELIRVSASNDEVLPHPHFINEYWLRNFVDVLVYYMNMIKLYNDSKLWPKCPSMCSPYGAFGVTGYPCQYKALCEQENWEDAAKFYQKNEWNPLSGYKNDPIKFERSIT